MWLLPVWGGGGGGGGGAAPERPAAGGGGGGGTGGAETVFRRIPPKQEKISMSNMMRKVLLYAFVFLRMFLCSRIVSGLKY